MKHNYDAAWMLFMAGAGIREVAKTLNLPHTSLEDYAKDHFWTERRTMARKHANSALLADLETRIEKARIRHQKFMLRELERTESTIEDLTAKAKPTGDDEVTVERKLGLLDKQDTIARRTLGLDEQGADPIQAGFAMLAAMSQAAQDQSQVLVNETKLIEKTAEGSEQSPLETPEAMVAYHPLDKNATTGILSSKNAIPDEVNGHKKAPEPTQIGQAGAIEENADKQELAVQDKQELPLHIYINPNEQDNPPLDNEK
jgi:hypothetical protein